MRTLIIILSCLWIERAGCVPRSYIVWSGRKTNYHIPFGESRSERQKAQETRQDYRLEEKSRQDYRLEDKSRQNYRLEDKSRQDYRLEDTSGYYSNQRLPISYLLPRFPEYTRYNNFRLPMDAFPFMAYQPKILTSGYEPSTYGFEASSYDRKYDWDRMKYSHRLFEYEDAMHSYSQYKRQKRNKNKYADIDSIPMAIHLYDRK